VKLKFVGSTIFFLMISINPAYSIVNGTAAVGSSFVVATWIGEAKNPTSGCTAAYLRPRVVVTAAHCVIKQGGRAPELAGPIDEFFVSQPGVDLPKTTERVRVLKIWTEPDYFNRWEPDKNLKETQINDVAFLFLEKELDGIPLSRAATREEVEEFRSGSLQAFHLGYGMIGGTNGEIAPNDGKPYLVEGIVGSMRIWSHIPIRDRQLEVVYPFGKSIGPGDSGSPLMMKKGNEILYIGTIYAGWGYHDNAKKNYVQGGASVTVLWPFITHLDQEWSKFLVEEPNILAMTSLRKEVAAKAAIERDTILVTSKNLGVLYREQTSCHSNLIIAELQSNKSGQWTSVAREEGWIGEPSCYQPWTIYRAEKGEYLRWRLSVIGGWEVFTPSFSEITTIREEEIAEEIAIAQLKVKQEAEAKASWELAAKLEAEFQAASIKKKTITCIKGKTTKKVTGLAPKCPAGFKKK
jgi:hypothetical protein